ncbi:MAG: hypothetical protein Q8O67_26075 [Deltaproteobacteria bacterium]|nr:hypothetical protein [Deltaproteobacteria bacterium]
MIAILFASVLCAQDPAGAPPPPPVVELAPTHIPDAAGPKALPKADKPAGWDTLPAAGAQLAAGTGACCISCCVAIPFAFVPIIGGTLGNIVSGIVIGGAETFVGDAISQKRGAMAWPILASSGILAGTGLINIGLTFALGLANVTPDPSDPAAYLGQLAIPLGVNVGGTLLAIGVPVLIYHLTAVEKEPGDTGGFGVPGFFAPADPTGTGVAKATPPTTAPEPDGPTEASPEVIQAY